MQDGFARGLVIIITIFVLTYVVLEFIKKCAILILNKDLSKEKNLKLWIYSIWI
jgi:hypothetical protein